MVKGCGGGYGFFLPPDGLCVECNQCPTIPTNSLIQFSSIVENMNLVVKPGL